MVQTCESNVILNSSIVKTSFSSTTEPRTMEERLHLAKQFFSHELLRQAGRRSDARITPQTRLNGDEEDRERHSRDDEMTLSPLFAVLVMHWLVLLFPFRWLESGPFLKTVSDTMLLLLLIVLLADSSVELRLLAFDDR